ALSRDLRGSDDHRRWCAMAPPHPIPLRQRRELQMSRGSKPGTKRGGRKRGTLNRRTILAERILIAAPAHPPLRCHDLLSVLIDDQALPADSRLLIAQQSRSAGARSSKPRAQTPNAKSPATSSQKHAAAELDSLVRLAPDVSFTEEQRRKAAARMAWILLP